MVSTTVAHCACASTALGSYLARFPPSLIEISGGPGHAVVILRQERGIVPAQRDFLAEKIHGVAVGGISEKSRAVRRLLADRGGDGGQ